MTLVHRISEFAESASEDADGGHLRMPTPHPAFLRISCTRMLVAGGVTDGSALDNRPQVLPPASRKLIKCFELFRIVVRAGSSSSYGMGVWMLLEGQNIQARTIVNDYLPTAEARAEVISGRKPNLVLPLPLVLAMSRRG